MSTDLWSNLMKFLDRQRYAVTGVVLSLLTAGVVTGCEATTTSLTDPKSKVTASQLNREIEIEKASLVKRSAMLVSLGKEIEADTAAFQGKIDFAVSDLESKQAVRSKIIETIGGIGTAVASGGITAPSAIGSVLQLLTLGLAGGAAMDSLRKNRVINDLKNKGV